MAVDRQNYKQKFEKTVEEMQKDETIQKILSDKELEEQEMEKLADKLNSPEDYFNEDNLKDAYDQPTGSLADFIKAALGKYKFPTKKERVNKNFDSWLRQKEFSPDQIMLLALLKNRFAAGDSEISIEDFTKPPLREHGGIQKAVGLFGEDGLKLALNEMNETVFI